MLAVSVAGQGAHVLKSCAVGSHRLEAPATVCVKSPVLGALHLTVLRPPKPRSPMGDGSRQYNIN